MTSSSSPGSIDSECSTAFTPAVAFGSHLDTVPTGGRFDGVFGVLAGLEVLRALDDAGVKTRAPLELVNWTNEEGSRFRPAMMGSRVHAGDMALEDTLAITDDKGVSVRDALKTSDQAGPIAPAHRRWAGWLEAHIEQGPVMEATNTDIGIVVGTMHARYFQLIVTGEPSHVGPTTMDRRRDSLAAAAEIVFVASAHAGDVLTAEAVVRTRFGRAGVYDVTVRRGGDVIAEFRGRSHELGSRPRAGSAE